MLRFEAAGVQVATTIGCRSVHTSSGNLGRGDRKTKTGKVRTFGMPTGPAGSPSALSGLAMGAEVCWQPWALSAKATTSAPRKAEVQ